MDKRLTTLTPSFALRSLADFLMPRECLVCGRQLLVHERHLCLPCLADLPLTHFWGMSHNPMADRFNALVEASSYVRSAALFFYSEDYGKITRALKYGRNFAAGRWAASLLGLKLREAGWQVDVVCPVPLHWTRRFSRGYNQAGIIGKAVAAGLGAAFAPRLLRRRRRTRTQTRLPLEGRIANVVGAFAVRHSELTCSSILLIDDVFTTGSTLAACYTALRAAFGDSVRISVATLGYVE